ncbi:hypothetical protein Taro_002039 [Colocasia esculenta]|uniref:Retrotransposon gag domain-containing protein n=1 Tax=Colocasia esculenta TaxID=4460 RepID=A0A843TCV2_COLES|nr:hypothetical protein [Colocasia esculenta]
MERFKRMSPPSFKGESNPLLAESWMREIEKIFGAIRCVEDDKVTLASYMLQKRADVWWSWMLRTRFEDGAVEVGWDDFVRLFRAKFVPEHIQDKMEQEFLSLTQGSMTVLEYKARFSELSKYAPHIVADERKKAKKFVMGLRPSLRTRLVAFDHRNLDEALSAACRQEGLDAWTGLWLTNRLDAWSTDFYKSVVQLLSQLRLALRLEKIQHEYPKSPCFDWKIGRPISASWSFDFLIVPPQDLLARSVD